MLEIGKTNFVIGVPSLPIGEFERYSSSLFDTWDGYVESSLKVPDYSLSLEIEEGSIKGKGCIAVALYALYTGIGNYGGFISGLQTIEGQISYASRKLVESASSPFAGNKVKTTIRNSGGSVSQLRRLFLKVQLGDLSADQAFSEAVRLLGEDAGSSPEFMKALKHELENAPRYPGIQSRSLSSMSLKNLKISLQKQVKVQIASLVRSLMFQPINFGLRYGESQRRTKRALRLQSYE